MLIGIDASRATAVHVTGTETYSLRLIEALLSLDTPHHFRLYFNQPPGHDLFSGAARPGRVEIRSIPFPRLWTHLRLGLEAARFRPDVLFVPSHVLPLWTRVPTLVTVHDLGYLHFPAAHPPGQRRYLNWSTRHNARMAHTIITDSVATKDDLKAQYKIAETKTIVAYPGFDENLAPVTDLDAITAAKRRYGVDDCYYVHIGTLQPRKNLSRLIEAFGRLPSDSGVQLVLAGKKGWLYDDLFHQVQSQGLEERVLFPGYVDDADKAALLSGAVAYVFPSLYEGFGFPALEAQACDTPLICANSSSLPEVAGDGALLVNPQDTEGLFHAMLRILTDTVYRDDLVTRGRDNLHRFSWQRCAETVMAALEEAAHASRFTNHDQ